MSFWESELGNVTGKAEDAFAKQFTQIPDGTKALARINSFAHQEHKESGFKYLNIEWLLQEGDFKGQKIQQKLKVYGGDQYDKDPIKTRHRALNMFKLLYQLFNISPKDGNPPTDQDLLSFVGKIAGIKIRETAPNDKGRQYNWVSEVHPSKDFKSETGIGLPIIAQTSVKINSSLQSPMNRTYGTDIESCIEDVPF